MNLYHGTYEDIFDEIVGSGAIRNDISSETTKEFDAILEEYLEFNPRSNCVYLTGDIECVFVGYDIGFKVHSSNLNTNLLFVADIRLVEDIIGAHYSGESSRAEIAAMCRDFNNSVIPFDKYITGKSIYAGRNLWELEFLYFDKIDLDNCEKI